MVFTEHRVKKYFLKKVKCRTQDKKKLFVICAKVFKYKFGFLIDFWDEVLDSKYKCRHENYASIYHRMAPPMLPTKKSELIEVLHVLNSKR